MSPTPPQPAPPPPPACSSVSSRDDARSTALLRPCLPWRPGSRGRPVASTGHRRGRRSCRPSLPDRPTDRLLDLRVAARPGRGSGAPRPPPAGWWVPVWRPLPAAALTGLAEYDGLTRDPVAWPSRMPSSTWRRWGCMPRRGRAAAPRRAGVVLGLAGMTVSGCRHTSVVTWRSAKRSERQRHSARRRRVAEPTEGSADQSDRSCRDAAARDEHLTSGTGWAPDRRRLLWKSHGHRPPSPSRGTPHEPFPPQPDQSRPRARHRDREAHGRTRARPSQSGAFLTTSSGRGCTTPTTPSRPVSAVRRCCRTTTCARRSPTSTTSASPSVWCTREEPVPTASSVGYGTASAISARRLPGGGRGDAGLRTVLDRARVAGFGRHRARHPRVRGEVLHRRGHLRPRRQQHARCSSSRTASSSPTSSTPAKPHPDREIPQAQSRARHLLGLRVAAHRGAAPHDVEHVRPRHPGAPTG